MTTMTDKERLAYDAVAAISVAVGVPIWGYDEHDPIWKDGTASYTLNVDGGFLRVALDMDADRDDIARADRAVRAATPVGIKCAVLALTKHEPPPMEEEP